jgi:hypothetical protein
MKNVNPGDEKCEFGLKFVNQSARVHLVFSHFLPTAQPPIRFEDGRTIVLSYTRIVYLVTQRIVGRDIRIARTAQL